MASEDNLDVTDAGADPRRGPRRARATSRSGSSSTWRCASSAAPSAASVPGRPRGAGAILALVGPPGVGKTSLGESVARALGRKFVRVSLGGVRDEAEIRGHRRTYVGAQPGRLARALREAGTMNPVIVLDEVDKLGSDYRGDPSSALLEVLDPAQNHTFRDHYLEVELDLSKVLFLATANVAETIPGPLLDRMEVIRIDGYTEDEKLSIARHHLLPRQLERTALRPDEVEVTDEALRAISADYTREAGVRKLERELGRLLRKVATKLASGGRRHRSSSGPTTSAPGSAGPASSSRRPTGRAVPGVATGLAVTGTGGDVLFVEATSMDGTEGLTLTGQLGDVMKESAEIALSYVRSHAAELGIDPDAFTGKRFHLHVPAGAVPKDGPSAGVTMTTALVEPAPGPAGAAGGRHDRRGHPAGPGAAHRRGQAEGAGRPPGRADRGRPARPQRPGPGGRPRGRARADDVPSGRDGRRRPGGRAGAGGATVSQRADRDQSAGSLVAVLMSHAPVRPKRPGSTGTRDRGLRPIRITLTDADRIRALDASRRRPS